MTSGYIQFKCNDGDELFILPKRLLDSVCRFTRVLDLLDGDKDKPIEVPFTYNQMEGFFSSLFLSRVDQETLDTFAGQWHIYPQMIDYFQITDFVLEERIELVQLSIMQLRDGDGSQDAYSTLYDKYKALHIQRHNVDTTPWPFKTIAPDNVHVAIVMAMIIDNK